MLLTIFPANHQVPLSGNKYHSLIYTLGIVVGLFWAFPLPLYIIPVFGIALIFPKYALALIWACIWGCSSPPTWVSSLAVLGLFLYSNQNSKYIFAALCMLLFLKIIWTSVWLTPIVVLLGVYTLRDGSALLKNSISTLAIVVTIYGGLSNWFVHQNLQGLHRIGVLEHWLSQNPIEEEHFAEVVQLLPTNHSFIQGYPLDLRSKVKAGWMPESAQLNLSDIPFITDALDEDGRRGEAIRLLKRHIRDPQLAWEYYRLLRLDEETQIMSEVLKPRKGTYSQGFHLIDHWWYTNGCDRFLLDTVSETSDLNLEFGIETLNSDIEISIIIDKDLYEFALNNGNTELSLALKYSGPHTAIICFLNDETNDGGDRNLSLKSIYF